MAIYIPHLWYRKNQHKNLVQVRHGHRYRKGRFHHGYNTYIERANMQIYKHSHTQTLSKSVMATA